MAAYVLVHGSWHDESGWDETATRLRTAGHHVSTPRLPPNESLPLSPGDIEVETYVDFIAGTVANQGERVVLVGHSMAGAIISCVAERFPERLCALVYLAAFLLEDGESIATFAERHKVSRRRGAAAHAVPTADGSASTIPASAARDLFYNTCSELVAARAAARLRPQPAKPRFGRVRVSAERFGAVPRAYFVTLQDGTIFPSLQAAMLERVPCERVVLLDTDHSPFLSAPARLATELAAVPAWAQRRPR